MAEMDLLGYETGSAPLQRIDVRGRRIGYRESGDEKAMPLVLLHGVGSGSASWGMQFVALPNHGLRVIAWDAPGYGGSDLLPQSAPTPDDFATALGGFADALGLKRFHLLGHSMGAIIAAAFCRMTGAERVARLILASPTSGYATASEERRRVGIDGRIQDMERLGPAAYAEQRAGNLLTPNAPKRAFVHVKAVAKSLRPDGYAKAVGMLGRGDMFAEAPGIVVPTLVLCGTSDTVTTEESCKRVAAAIKGARYQPLFGPGHACYIEAPGPFETAVVDFLAAP